jgi:hypothetical protein
VKAEHFMNMIDPRRGVKPKLQAAQTVSTWLFRTYSPPRGPSAGEGYAPDRHIASIRQKTRDFHSVPARQGVVLGLPKMKAARSLYTHTQSTPQRPRTATLKIARSF